MITTITQLKNAIQPDYVVVGGGKIKLIEKLPAHVYRGDNFNAFIGAFGYGRSRERTGSRFRREWNGGTGTAPK